MTSGVDLDRSLPGWSSVGGAPARSTFWTPRQSVLAAVTLSVVLVVLAGLVKTGALIPRLDRSVLAALRPHDEWAGGQRFADRIVEGLRPSHSMVFLAVIAVVVSVWRRSWRPVIVAGCCQAAIALGTWALKTAVASSDPHHDRIGGGSFPSGHTGQLLVTFGLLALLMQTRRTRALAWMLTGIATGSMAFALVVEGAHWTSDVIGGGLLAGIVLLLARSAMYSRSLSPLLIHSRVVARLTRGSRNFPV